MVRTHLNFCLRCVCLFQAYHSSFEKSKLRVANMALLPIRTRYSGPAPTETCKIYRMRSSTIIKIDWHFFMLIATENEDIIDEAIKFFRANIFFRNYDIKVSQIDR